MKLEVERKILSNTLLLATGQFVIQAANFTFVILFARAFGASVLGVYSLAMAIGALLSIFASLGTNSLAAQKISRVPDADREIIGKVAPLQIMAGVAVWLALVIVVLALSTDRSTAWIIALVVLSHVIQKWRTLLMARFQSRQSMQLVAVMQAGTRVGILALGALAIYGFENPMLAVASFPVVAMLGLPVAYLAGNRRFGAPKFSLRAGDVVDIVRRAWPFLFLLILAVLYERLGIIFLRLLQSDSAVGYFAAAERLLVPFNAMFAVFVAAILPAMSRIPPEEGVERDALARRFLRVLLALVLPAATLMYLFRSDIILFLYGAQFEQAISVLTILAWVVALRGFNAFLSMFSIAAGQQMRLGTLKLCALLVFVTLSAVLIPLYSYSGLAYAVAASDLFLAIVMYWSLRRNHFLDSLFSLLWRPCLCCLVAMVVIWGVSTQALGYRLMYSLATLAVTALLTGAVKHHDFLFLLRIASGRRAYGDS